jgi:superfamily II DNA or RNA helicase
VQQRSVRLRPWQKAALEQFNKVAAPDFLAVATPGAGKTTFALAAALTDLAANPRRRVVVVTPTQHLKLQWTRVAAQYGLHLEPSWAARDGRLPADMHGVVVTYQQVAQTGMQLRSIASDAFVVLDEVHHAGEERAWGDGLIVAFEHAARRLSISGTPFRSDTNAIPFIRYADDEAWADYVYGYGEALEDGGVVRPVFFPRVDGQMEWSAPDGTMHSHTFADPLDHARANQRLRTALSLGGEWLPDVLDQAHEQLLAIRRVHPSAGGLVIAMDTEHARGIADLIRARFGIDPVIATSEDPQASTKIARFGASEDLWIVAVRMVSEGVDLPRLRVGVYATNTTTELFFRQAVGRLVRWTKGLRRQKAFMFIPDDYRLRTHAVQIADQRRHSLRKPEDAQTDDDELLDVTEPTQDSEEQLSLFAAISAVAIGDRHSADSLLDDDDDHDEDEDADDSLTIALAAPPLELAAADAGAGTTTMTRQEHKLALRNYNADRARTLVQLTGMSHAQVNAELNRLAGIDKISEATIPQLGKRLEQARAWLRRL